MKICIVSDSHDNRPLLEAAVADARSQGAEAVVHCGDVVAPSTLNVLRHHELPVHVIHGNNAGDLYMMARIASQPNSFITFYGQDAGIELGGKKIFIVHYPHYAQAMATTGNWDMVCCGHDHKANIESVANMNGEQTLLVNPGTTGGIAAPATYAIGDLESMAFDIRPVPEPTLEKEQSFS